MLCGKKVLEMNSSNSDAGPVRAMAPGEATTPAGMTRGARELPDKGQLHAVCQQCS